MLPSGTFPNGTEYGTLLPQTPTPRGEPPFVRPYPWPAAPPPAIFSKPGLEANFSLPIRAIWRERKFCHEDIQGPSQFVGGGLGNRLPAFSGFECSIENHGIRLGLRRTKHPARSPGENPLAGTSWG